MPADPAHPTAGPLHAQTLAESVIADESSRMSPSHGARLADASHRAAAPRLFNLALA